MVNPLLGEQRSLQVIRRESRLRLIRIDIPPGSGYHWPRHLVDSSPESILSLVLANDAFRPIGFFKSSSQSPRAFAPQT
jgi:hypothetical protein